MNANWFLLLVIVFTFSCSDSSIDIDNSHENNNTLFYLMNAKECGIDFKNTIKEGLNTNILMYEYFYNGGGVAVGDVNGDGLEDVYFTSNMESNRLYLNKGGMKFIDITVQSGVSGRPGPWKTGTTMGDVNGDGLLDIYVCYSGSLPAEKRKNELYINEGPNDQGIPSFSERGEEYGLASVSTSTQATFFDYDNDGDLDMFLLNHNPKSLPVLDEASTTAILKDKDPAGSQLFRNDDNVFAEVTSEAGIQNSALSYGLGAGVSDVNKDGWLDIYVCNDYTVPDFLYINNGDGTFTDQLGKHMGHTSHFSMGNDISDINNDGLPDIYSLDMLPEDNERQKLLMSPDNYEKFDFNVEMGFHHQYMRNMLQLNNGNNTFSEIGQVAGISNTDWSWASLFADYNNDGWKDLYITNGYLRDYTNLDFLKYMGDFVQHNEGSIRRENVLELVSKMPSSNLVNYVYKSNGDLTFKDVIQEWGMDYKSNSNGAAYADFDNDGDLDIVVNNINKNAFVYKNNTDSLLGRNFLKVRLKSKTKNTWGIGTKVTVFINGQSQFLEQIPTRGFQSSVSPILHFGLGNSALIDSVKIDWLGGGIQVIRDVKANQTIEIEEGEGDSKLNQKSNLRSETIFKEVSPSIQVSFPEKRVNDFKRQPLMVNPMSFFAPVLLKTDVDVNGRDDIFVGGQAGSPGKLFIQGGAGQYMEKKMAVFEYDRHGEDIDAAFFDANGDGFPDLYIARGGYGEFQQKDQKFQDRIYINDGEGNFQMNESRLPPMLTSSGTVTAGDVDNDGDMDLFIGGRVVPGRYPETPNSYLLINDGSGFYEDHTDMWSKELAKIGMVSDASWIDVNGDNNLDLLVVGEWMPVTVFINNGQSLENKTKEYFDRLYSGWWNTIMIDDLDNDGFIDIILGNHGLNSQIKASESEPTHLYYKDFDKNGSLDPILCTYIGGELFPYITRDELLDQMAMMRTRFTDYATYANAKFEDVFTEEELEGVKELKVNCLTTSWFELKDNGKFEKKDLPLQVQHSPVFSILPYDYNEDGVKDLIMCGNINEARLRLGKFDANYGILLKGKGDDGFEYISQNRSGFGIKGDVRGMVNADNTIFFGINGKGIIAYKRTD